MLRSATVWPLILGLTIVLSTWQYSSANDIVYTPINPSFGGDPLNGNFLINGAQIQNEFTESSSRTSREETDPLSEFTDTLQRRLLGAISAQIVESIYGENPSDDGTFQVGDTQVNFDRVGDQVNVTILDLATGGETTISLPAPQF